MNSGEWKKLLLHTCCGPCASGCVGTLRDCGRDFALYFSNSNLNSAEEYEKRLAAARTLAAAYGLELEADPYDHAAWLRAVSVLPGYADAPERGARCRLCFAYSLGRTARRAAESGWDFTTTLTVSPHKNAQTIFAEGRAYPHFEPWDFKKRDGFRKSLEQSRLLGLYRQKFCGCEFSFRSSQPPSNQES